MMPLCPRRTPRPPPRTADWKPLSEVCLIWVVAFVERSLIACRAVRWPLAAPPRAATAQIRGLLRRPGSAEPKVGKKIISRGAVNIYTGQRLGWRRVGWAERSSTLCWVPNKQRQCEPHESVQFVRSPWASFLRRILWHHFGFGAGEAMRPMGHLKCS